MIQVTIDFPEMMLKPITRQFKSIRAASNELGLSYYFLYNCISEYHYNQFNKFITVKYVQQDPYIKRQERLRKKRENAARLRRLKLQNMRDMEVEEETDSPASSFEETESDTSHSDGEGKNELP